MKRPGMIAAFAEAVGPLGAAVHRSAGLRLGFLWNLGLLGFSLLAWPWDHRHILGLNPWIKPIKFQISTLIYVGTIAIMMGSLADPGRWRRSLGLLGWGFGTAMIVENTLITVQSVRGVPSHMNYTSPLNGLIFGVMGVFIVVNTVLAAWLLWLWCRQTTVPRVIGWGVRVGLGFLLAGSLEGMAMVTGGGHTVGARDGGAGLPFVNWSTAHGDLRVAHFFALHALQLMPVLGLLLARSPWKPQSQVAVLLGSAALYGLGLWWLFTQATAGRPILPL